MSRNKKKNKEVVQPANTKPKFGINKNFWIKAFSILLLVLLFLVPTLSLLINYIAPSQPTTTSIPSQTIKVSN